MPFFERDGLALHYSDVGSGPPVLLLHGWGGRGRRQWHGTMQRLGARFRFIALDLRGHGRSSEARVPDYGWDELVGDCEALRTMLGIAQWIVVGYSFGGLVALEYARRRPDAVAAVCAVAPMVLPVGVAQLVRWLKWPMAWILRLARVLPPSLSGKTLHNVAKTRLRTLFHTVRMMEDWTAGPSTIDPRVPVTIMVGSRDRVAHSDRAVAVARAVDLRILKDAGHFPLWRQRERFVKELELVLTQYAR